jgi:hypothetical protein
LTICNRDWKPLRGPTDVLHIATTKFDGVLKRPLRRSVLRHVQEHFVTSARRDQATADCRTRYDPPMNAYSVKRCLLCGDPNILAKIDGRIVTTSCVACHAVLIIEFDPPDAPTLRARIERIDDSTDGGVLASDRDRRTRRTSGSRNSPIVPAA